MSYTDTFDGPQLDLSLWTYSLPYGDSNVYQSGGYLNLVNRGTLFSKYEYGPVISIEGSLKFSGSSYDFMRVFVRTDKYMTSLAASSQLTHGIQITMLPGYPVSISEFFGFPESSDIPNYLGWRPLSSSDSSYFGMGVEQTFKVTDDGYNIDLFINDMNTPVATAQTSLRYGGYLAMQNREGGLGGSWESDGSVVQINSLSIAPEPSTYALLLLSGAASLVALKRRKTPTREPTAQSSETSSGQ